MNILSRDQQIQIIAALTEGTSIRAVERLTGVHRDTIMRLGARVGAGCAALHDHTMHSLRVGRLELDEILGFVGCKQKNVKRKDLAVTSDQYTFIALASTARAIITYRTGKRDSANTHEFAHDLGEEIHHLGVASASFDQGRRVPPNSAAKDTAVRASAKYQRRWSLPSSWRPRPRHAEMPRSAWKACMASSRLPRPRGGTAISTT
jgi:hypothetical protein